MYYVPKVVSCSLCVWRQLLVQAPTTGLQATLQAPASSVHSRGRPGSAATITKEQQPSAPQRTEPPGEPALPALWAAEVSKSIRAFETAGNSRSPKYQESAYLGELTIDTRPSSFAEIAGAAVALADLNKEAHEGRKDTNAVGEPPNPAEVLRALSASATSLVALLGLVLSLLLFGMLYATTRVACITSLYQ